MRPENRRQKAKSANEECRALFQELAARLIQDGYAPDTVAVAFAGSSIMHMCERYGEGNARDFLRMLFDGFKQAEFAPTISALPIVEGSA